MALQMKLPYNECWPTLIIPLVFTATLATLALNKWKCCLAVDWATDGCPCYDDHRN